MEDTKSYQDKPQTITIHGKEYMPVAERIKLAHGVLEKISITTEVLPSTNAIVIKATVLTDKGTFTGISSANPQKYIEKVNPYEVAETSAVGRALGFAGYGVIDSIASADEMAKSFLSEPTLPLQGKGLKEEERVCSAHETPEKMFQGKSKSKVDAQGNPKTYWWHKSDTGQICFGDGYQD